MIESDILIKEECETDPRYGCEPEKREINDYIKNGIVIIDKIKGPTSHQISSWIKEILSSFNVNKVGHSGTLDPQVTGVLPCLIQNATKIGKILTTADKEYVGVIKFENEVKEKEIKRIFEYFTGEIYQLPPKDSAVRKIIRRKKIYKSEFLEISDDHKEVLFKVSCESGTYVRVLCEDIGLILGNKSVMDSLRRIRSGIFDEKYCVKLHDLRDAYEIWKETGDEKELRRVILPMERGIVNIKKIWIKDSAVNSLCYGGNLNIPGIAKLEKGIKVNDDVALLTLKNELIAIGKSLRTSEEILKMESGEAVDVERVIMERDVYPRRW
ncbi:MAG: RNA-guided pseudouridylation complex pseudouridine synthase subunit Cbf5 [Candidatus Altarchaeaceae archaeon]